MSTPQIMEPSACAWCGIAERGHARQYADAAGWHKWEQPSQEQILARMKARRLQLAVARAGAYPTPVGGVRTLDVVESELTGVNLALWEEIQAYARLRLALTSAQRGRRELRAQVAQVAALLEERHSTNESVSEAAEALRVQRDRIAELETGIAWRDAERERWSGVHYLIEKAIDKGWSGVDTCTLEAELGPEPAPVPAESVAEPSCPCPPADQPGPHQVGCFFDGVPVSPPSERPVNELTAKIMPVAAHREDPHDSPLHHDYRVGHDLPELGGA